MESFGYEEVFLEERGEWMNELKYIDIDREKERERERERKDGENSSFSPKQCYKPLSTITPPPP